MSDSRSAKCPRCGSPLVAEAAEGLCPRCLLALNLGPDTVFTGDDEVTVAKAEPLLPEQLAPHFPHLEILECLGRGGMGVVYKARQKTLNRFVALKLLAPERVTDAKFADRFAREAQALAALNHPHIVTVYDFGIVDARVPPPEGAAGVAGHAAVAHAQLYFLLMEFVDGLNLRQAMNAGRFTPEQALAVVPPVCEALQFAHEHGIVHRDIKPENLLLDKRGRIKIADFGIAHIIGRDTDTTVRGDEHEGASPSLPAGTPQYMAPEQKKHQATDSRADIYSLGVVLYELLTGVLPADKLKEPWPCHHGTQINERLNSVVQRALHENPEMRYQTAADMRTHLETILVSPDRPKRARRPRDSEWFGVIARHSNPLLPRLAPGKVLLAAGLILLAAVFAFIFLPSRPSAIPGDVESVDFDSGSLSDFFTTNLVFGKNPYTLASLGVDGSQGLGLDDSMATEGTLVFKKKSYDLSTLASLEISCLFRRQAIGAGTHAINLGLTQSTEGNLSGVKGDGWVGLRLAVEGESLRMEFQAKQTGVARPKGGSPGDEIITEVGKWYQYKVTFTRVNDVALRVTGEVRNVSDRGKVASQVGYFPPINHWVKDFLLEDILADHELWVALRANGAGGVDALDNLRIVARPLPVKVATPTPAPKALSNQAEPLLSKQFAPAFSASR